MDNIFLNRRKRDINKYLPDPALSCGRGNKTPGKSFFLDLVFLCLVMFSGLYVWSIVDSVREVYSVTTERHIEHPEQTAEGGL